jgi:hypothetical protein
VDPKKKGQVSTVELLDNHFTVTTKVLNNFMRREGIELKAQSGREGPHVAEASRIELLEWTCYANC